MLVVGMPNMKNIISAHDRNILNIKDAKKPRNARKLIQMSTNRQLPT